jgi:hypothetical protein
MTVYGFNDKQNAQALDRFASEILGNRNNGQDRIGEDSLIVRVPAGETLGARDGDTVGELLCEIYQLGTSGELSNTGNTCLVYNKTESEYAEDTYLDVARVKSLWVVLGSTLPPAPMVQFRLKSGWQGTGVSTATILSSTSDDHATGDVTTVYDYKKLFQHAIGSEESPDANGGSIGWAIKVDVSGDSRFLVTQCTQKINRYEATIANGICTGSWGESLSVTNPIARSVWPYTDIDPSISGTGELDVINVHGLAANGGQVWIEFESDPAVPQDPDNSVVPYSVGTSPTGGRWVITDVEKPIANYIQCKWNGSSWDFSQGNNVYDGNQPDAEFNVVIAKPAHLNVLGENGGAACLEVETMGLARIDRSASTPVELKYFVCMTSSSLNGEVHKAAIAGTLSPTNSKPPVEEEIIVVDGCEVQYKRIGKTFVFGSPTQTGSCEMTEEVVDQPFKNWVDSTVVESIEDVGGELKMKKLDIKTCFATPAADQALPLVSMDVVNDVYCSGSSLTKDYKTIKFFGSVENSSSGVAIDTSCIDIDYTQIINYPTVPYIDYYDIIWPTGCVPCDPIGCCSGGTEDGNDVTSAVCVAGGGTWSSTPCSTGTSPCLTGCSVCSGDVELTGLSVSWTTVDGGSGAFDGVVLVNTISGNGSCGWTVDCTLTSTDPAISNVSATATVEVITTDRVDLTWTPATFAGVTLPTRMDGFYGQCEQDFGFSHAGVTPATPDGGAGGSWGEADAGIVSCVP